MGSSAETTFDFKSFETQVGQLGKGLTATPHPTELFQPEMLQVAFPGMTAEEWRGYFSSDEEAQEALTAQTTKEQVVDRVFPGITKEELQGYAQTKAITEIAELIAEATLLTDENPRVIEVARTALSNCPEELIGEILQKAQKAYSTQ